MSGDLQLLIGVAILCLGIGGCMMLSDIGAGVRSEKEAIGKQIESTIKK